MPRGWDSFIKAVRIISRTQGRSCVFHHLSAISLIPFSRNDIKMATESTGLRENSVHWKGRLTGEASGMSCCAKPRLSSLHRDLRRLIDSSIPEKRAFVTRNAFRTIFPPSETPLAFDESQAYKCRSIITTTIVLLVVVSFIYVITKCLSRQHI